MSILARNYRTTYGEVDLVARDGGVVVFVEVKSRRQTAPAEAVTPEKQRRLTVAALHFLRRYQLLEAPARFDVVTVVQRDASATEELEHLRDAFPAVGRGQMFS